MFMCNVILIESFEEAFEFVKNKKIVPLTQTEDYSSLVVAIVGSNIEGSWWGHPKGHLIYEISEKLSESSEILTIKLVRGKITYIYKSLWPALVRIITDDEWKRKRIDNLNPIAKRIFIEVEKKEKVRSDELRNNFEIKEKSEKRNFKKAVIELESSLLAYSKKFHTNKGYHTTELIKWETWITTQLKKEAEKLDFTEATRLFSYKLI